jgi:predicted phosphodiesterase
MRIVCISDTHGLHRELSLPPGDILIHAGDFSYFGRDRRQVDDFAEWIGSLPFKHVIVVAGNHDYLFDPNRDGYLPMAMRGENFLSMGHRYLSDRWSSIGASHCHYLQDTSLTIDGIKFFGSPYQRPCADMAFTVSNDDDLIPIWELIPTDIDVLVTHMPPLGIFDKVVRDRGGVIREDLGCRHLMNKIRRIKPLKAHIFGHIHESYGRDTIGDVTFINASICGSNHKVLNPPIVLYL